MFYFYAMECLLLPQGAKQSHGILFNRMYTYLICDMPAVNGCVVNTNKTRMDGCRKKCIPLSQCVIATSMGGSLTNRASCHILPLSFGCRPYIIWLADAFMRMRTSCG